MEREYNYDLLRVISMLAVILIHISNTWVLGFTEYVAEGGNVGALVNPIIPCFYNTITRFAVPCFVMLSGAFLLDDNRTANYHVFYKKQLMKIGKPTFIIGILYVLYRIPLCFLGEKSGTEDIVALIRDIFVGKPFYHMWYMYMLIGLYLMAPIVVRFKNTISYEKFRKIAMVFLIVASISNWTTGQIRINWDIGQSFEYLGYFMIGYVIRKDLSKNNLKGILIIFLGIIVELVATCLEYKIQIVKGISEGKLMFSIINPYCPIIVFASVLIFAGFTMLHIRYNRQIEKLAGISLIIYLVHGGVWDLIIKFMFLINGRDFVLNYNR